MRNRFAQLAAVSALWVAGCTPTAVRDKPAGKGTGGQSSGSQSGGSGGNLGENTGGSSGSGGSAGSGGAATGQSGGSGGSGGSADAGSSSSAGSGGVDAASGTSSDAGAGSDGQGPGGAAVGCTGANAKFCSDWEDQTAGAAPNGKGEFAVSGGGVTVDGAKGFSGTKSLHFKPSGTVHLNFTKQFPLQGQYGRMMLFVAKAPTQAIHWDIVESETTNAGNGHVWEWGGMYGKYQLTVDKPDDGKDSQTVIPSAEWFCVQWTYKGAGSMTEYHVKMNGMEVDKSPVNNHWVGGTWTNLLVGFESYGGNVPIEFWLDDLAFGDQAEIPCPAK
jgi:hypothetical protein